MLAQTLRGCWHVLFSNVQVMILSLLSLHLIGPRNFTNAVAALAMVASVSVVTLPERSHLVIKQLVFG
uniref:Uncharacterized protein n=1 Tax=Cajanus cajan TaxID=3821 RepID=A0A151QMU3_CAJCA|nr:hypothetical protein KK1_048011 [Cajanus cajan]